ncbi:hypothetical protein NSK_005353 [Nannochloropsis salina CCMP1776]|uniref:Large ribosomal subunit protein uL4m n=1 Tax=Nannochloropsis salina CCMP1776 TaxID=1027361 RepID=A0A4D9CVN3_9STRA|nr:hypothetical protein NSK_005353 [Nannochloropsis salina CCMP1776]|eukprot:TFJ83351.1 hypothetical protein NSK_005353 [Nannochloropsis salina CCMP1776]
MTEAISRPLASSLPCTRHCNSTAKSAIRLPRNDSSLRPTPTLLQRVARIRLLSSLLPSIGARSSSSLHTSAEHTSPPPPPPPPPPPSSSTLSIPSNLVLADPSVLTAFKPVSVEDRLKKKEEMEGIIDPKLLTLPVRKSIGDVNQEEAETINLDSRVFGVPVRKDIIHRLVTWQRAKQRVGMARTKRVGDIRGSTKKLRPQKGTGRARAGKKHAAQFRGGAKAHGPVPRDFSFKLNRKVRALGVRMALSAKAREDKRMPATYPYKAQCVPILLQAGFRSVYDLSDPSLFTTWKFRPYPSSSSSSAPSSSAPSRPREVETRHCIDYIFVLPNPLTPPSFFLLLLLLLLLLLPSSNPPPLHPYLKSNRSAGSSMPIIPVRPPCHRDALSLSQEAFPGFPLGRRLLCRFLPLQFHHEIKSKALRTKPDT